MWGSNTAGDYNRLPRLAADLIQRNVEAIATVGNPATVAAKGATSTIPIVFGIGGDPIELGFVTSLARPNGNLTGVTIINVELIPKRFGLISELVPQVRVITLLINPNNPGSEHIIRDVQGAARTRGRDLAVLRASSESEIDAVFASFAPPQSGALIVGSDQFFFSRREQLVALAARHTVPAIYQWREFPAAGGLMSYGSSLTVAWSQAGAYVGRILAGAKPVDLPVQQPTTFELVVNLKIAEALGLTVPPAILARADEVIE